MQAETAPRRQLTTLDATSVVVGTIIGAGIYQTAAPIAGSVTNIWMLLGLWIAGGLFSICGALCYAELASMFPRDGGDYVYLSKAYGPEAGFIFGWLQTFLIRPGDIAIIALAFGTYFEPLIRGFADAPSGWASAS